MPAGRAHCADCRGIAAAGMIPLSSACRSNMIDFSAAGGGCVGFGCQPTDVVLVCLYLAVGAGRMGKKAATAGNKFRTSLALPTSAVMNCADNTGAKNLYIMSVKGYRGVLNRRLPSLANPPSKGPKTIPSYSL